jgi:hypothetical protein
MNICFNLFFTFIHFVLTYGLFLTILFSNNINHLILGLVVLVAIRYSYYIWGRCILTLGEDNDLYPSLVHTCSSMFTLGLDDKIAEEIIINIGLLSAINKLFVLIVLKKYSHWFGMGGETSSDPMKIIN